MRNQSYFGFRMVARLKVEGLNGNPPGPDAVGSKDWQIESSSLILWVVVHGRSLLVEWFTWLMFLIVKLPCSDQLDEQDPRLLNRHTNVPASVA